jgi:hypothetical protein
MSNSTTNRSRIQVFCRFRPQNKREKEENGQLCLQPRKQSESKDTNEKHEEQHVYLKTLDDATHTYSFDRVFFPESTQEQVYESTGKPIIQAVLNGFNGAIIAYGQTGAGKTYSMGGGSYDSKNQESRGIINRAMDQLFQYANDSNSCIEFEVKVSFVEIYNENILDLLNPASNKNLKIQNSKVVGCREIFATSPQEMERILEIGAASRASSATLMNEGSSRSHSLFIVTVVQYNSETGEKISGQLVLVDLAGSEMVKKTAASGKRLEEAKSINKSLSALGNVINALTTKGNKSTMHIPYRDSKLTRLLENSLGGNSRTALVLACSPSSWNEMETLSTLRFGNRAKQIENRQVRQVEKSPAEMKKYIKELEALVNELRNKEKDVGKSDTKEKVGKEERLDQKEILEEVVEEEVVEDVMKQQEKKQEEDNSERSSDNVHNNESDTNTGSGRTKENSTISNLLMNPMTNVVPAVESRLAEQLEDREKDLQNLKVRVQKSEEERTLLLEKITRDSEKMCKLIMELDSASHRISELEMDASASLRRKAQKADRERAMIAVNYKHALAANTALRREVEALEGLAVRYQMELSEAKMFTLDNGSSVELKEENENNNTRTSETKFRKSFTGGGSNNTSWSSTTTVMGDNAPNLSTTVENDDALIDVLLRDHGSLWEDIIIKSRSTFEYPVVIRNAGSRLIYFMQLEDYDVSYKVIEMNEIVGSDSNNIIIAPSFKMKASDGPHKKILFQHEHACSLKLIFDNTYSIFRSKKIRFAFAVCDDKQIARAKAEVSGNKRPPVSRSRAPSSRASSVSSTTSVGSTDSFISNDRDFPSTEPMKVATGSEDEGKIDVRPPSLSSLGTRKKRKKKKKSAMAIIE